MSLKVQIENVYRAYIVAVTLPLPPHLLTVHYQYVIANKEPERDTLTKYKTPHDQL